MDNADILDKLYDEFIKMVDHYLLTPVLMSEVEYTGTPHKDSVIIRASIRGKAMSLKFSDNSGTLYTSMESVAHYDSRLIDRHWTNEPEFFNDMSEFINVLEARLISFVGTVEDQNGRFI